jgi:RNA polymerase sigma-70 factor, ECF subfamily
VILDDQTLVRKLHQKDAGAERYFYKTNYRKLRHIATHILGYRDAEVDDVVQETCLAAFKDLSTFEFKSSFFHWLRRICVYRCYERIRQRKRQVASLGEELERFSSKASMEKDGESARAREHAIRLEILVSEREKLGKPCLEILDLRDQQEKNYGEISRLLKVPVGTVMSRLARCKEALKELFLRAARGRGLFNG